MPRLLHLSLLSLLIQLAVLYVRHGSCEAVQITQENFPTYRNSKDIIMLNFYADWCRFSQMLRPIFDKAADTLSQEFPERVLLGKVNCETDKPLCSSPFHITKYPTLKLIRHGSVARKEYRGQRSVDAIAEFVRTQLNPPVEVIKGTHELAQKEVKRAVVGFFTNNDTTAYMSFAKAAINLRDDCPFYAVLGQDGKQEVVFKNEGVADEMYPGDLAQFAFLVQWIHERCVPLVREITFANGEELTEEGLPLLLLFYNPDDPSIKEVYRKRVEAELGQHRGTVNVVTADGVMFAHPLHHLGKHKNDLPVIAIDSFRHMYVFPKFEDLHVPGKLNQFISDLHSGKLHKDFHNPPPPSQEPETEQQPSQQTQQRQQTQQHQQEKRNVPADPPESTFKKLKPAQSRYSFRDEL